MLPLLIAAAVEASPSPDAVKSWLEVFLYLGGVLLTAAGIYKLLAKTSSRTELAGQPIEIKAARDFVMKGDHEKSVAELKTELLRHAARRAEIYEALTEQGGEIKALKQETAAQTRDLAALKNQINETNSRIDEIPSRTISLLNATKELHQR